MLQTHEMKTTQQQAQWEKGVGDEMPQLPRGIMQNDTGQLVGNKRFFHWKDPWKQPQHN